MGVPWREGKLGIDWPRDSPWWDILGWDFDPYLSVEEFKFLKKYNLREVPEEEWIRDYTNSVPSCENCSRARIRQSTGCPWCYVRGIQPVGLEICDLYIKKYHTNTLLEYSCPYHWDRWFLREMKMIDENFEYFKTIK